MSLEGKCPGGCNVCIGKCKSYGASMQSQISYNQSQTIQSNNPYNNRNTYQTGGINNGYSS